MARARLGYSPRMRQTDPTIVAGLENIGAFYGYDRKAAARWRDHYGLELRVLPDGTHVIERDKLAAWTPRKANGNGQDDG